MKIFFQKRKIEIISLTLSILVHFFILLFIIIFGLQTKKAKFLFVSIKDLIPEKKKTEIPVKTVSKEILNLHTPGIAELRPKFSTGGELFFDPLGRSSREKGKEGTEIIGLEKVIAPPENFTEGLEGITKKETGKTFVPKEKKEAISFEKAKIKVEEETTLMSKHQKDIITQPEIDNKEGSPPKLAKTGPEEKRKKSLLSLTKCFFDSYDGNSCLIRKGIKKLPEFDELKCFCYEKQINDAITHSWRNKYKNRYRRWIQVNRHFLSRFGLRGISYSLMLGRNGEVKEIELKSTSGNAEVDEIMIECVRKTSFPPIPKHFKMDTYIPIGCTTIVP
jgi:hypothetical protein